MTIKEGYKKVTLSLKTPDAELPIGPNQVLKLEIKRPSKGNPYKFPLRQDYECCLDPSYQFVVMHNAGKIETQLELEVVGGCPPYTWVAHGGALRFDYPITALPTNYVSMDDCTKGTDPEGDLIVVTDACGIEVSCLVRNCIICGEDDGGGGGGGFVCESIGYNPPSLEKINTYDTFAFPVFIQSVVWVAGGGMNYYIDNLPIMEPLYDDNNKIFVAWMFTTTQGQTASPSAYVKRISTDRAYLVFPGYINLLDPDKDYIAITNHKMCGCTNTGVYEITNGRPPFTVEYKSVSTGGGDEDFVPLMQYYKMDHRLFTWYSDAPDCSVEYKLRVVDYCEISSNLLSIMSDGMTTWGRVWYKGTTQYGTIDISCDERIGPFSFQLFYERCAKSFYFETAGLSSGTLDVEYAEKEVTCIDGFGQEVKQTITYPVRAYFTVTTDISCCPGGTEYLDLYVCPDGSPARVLLHRVKINILGASDMEWLLKPTLLGYGVDTCGIDNLFVVDNGVPPYVWSLQDIEGGAYQNFTLCETVNMTGMNRIKTAFGCGTAKLVVSDACTTLEAYVTCTQSGWYVDLWKADVKGYSGTGSPFDDWGEGDGYTLKNFVETWYDMDSQPLVYTTSMNTGSDYDFTAYWYEVRTVGGFRTTEYIEENKQSVSPTFNNDKCDDYTYATISSWQDYQHGWNAYYPRGGLAAWHFSSADTCTELGRTAYNIPPRMYCNSDRPCWYWNSLSPYYAFTYYIRAFKVEIWVC